MIALAAVLLRIWIGETNGWPRGAVGESVMRVFFDHWYGERAYFNIMRSRITRVVVAAIVGWALATSGVGLQALLRNPLAEPFILGLSSGAAVGVMAQEMFGYYTHAHLGPLHVGAVAGALVSMTVVYLAGRRRGMIDPLGLLLVGVVLSTVNGALIMMMRHLYEPGNERNNVGQWMMGYLNEFAGSWNVLVISLVTLAGWLILMVYARALDASAFSDAEAMSLGVDLHRLRKMLFAISGILAAGAVVLGGPIAFVGLIAPHLARLLLGPGHRTLLPGAALIGATLILLADSASTVCEFGHGNMPIGIFTAMIGGPAFLWMLRPHLGRGME